MSDQRPDQSEYSNTVATRQVGLRPVVEDEVALVDLAAGPDGRDPTCVLDLWASVWGGSEFPGRGGPGETDGLPRREE